MDNTQRLWVGKGENGSDVSGVPESERTQWGDLKGYLEKTLSLEGYVYSYTFSEIDGRIANQGRELGDQTYDNPASRQAGKRFDNPERKCPLSDSENKIRSSNGQGNCWFEQAKEDFKQWFHDFGPGSKENPKRYPTEAEIPQKYILIAHCMGGLASRSYIFSDYYNNDVASLITIATPHKGTPSAKALKELWDYYVEGKHIVSTGTLLGVTLGLLMAGRDDLAVYTGVATFLVPLAYNYLDNVYIRDKFGFYGAKPSAQDLNPDSDFFIGLNSRKLKANADPIKVRTIAGNGVPTPSGDEISSFRGVPGVGLILTLTSSRFWNELPFGAKLMSIYLGTILGYPVDQDGDWFVTKDSGQGIGLSNFIDSRIDFKNISTYRFGKDSDVIKDAFMGIYAALAAENFIEMFGGPLAAVPAKFATVISLGYPAANLMADRFDNYLSAHGLVLKKVYEDKIIDRALEDFVSFGGKINTAEVRSGISASTVSNSAEGYTPPEQAFALLSNLDKDGNPMSTYHTVTIEAFTEGGGDPSQLFPIEINGQKKWVSSVTVKELPTAFKGVINTFLPKKLKRFDYSENFSAWKPVGEVDEWGNFTIRDLHFSEGCNVLSFNAESWVGNKANVQFRIVCNTIPQFVRDPVPAPGASTNNVYQTISVEANKASYSSDPSERINVISFMVDGVERSSEARVISSQSTYTAHARAEWTPREPLSEGQHDVLVRFQSNVGVSQAIWSFMVDTTAPTISIGTLETYAARAPGKELNIKYSTSDNFSEFLKDVSIRLYRGFELITEITQVATQAAGEQFVTWDGKKADGSYIEDGTYTVRIKAFDQAGNWGMAETELKVDSTPPVIAGVDVTPNPMTSNTTELGLTARVNEKSIVFIKLNNNSNRSTSAYLTQATSAPDGSYLASYTWRYNDMFIKGPVDGVYSVEVIARDEAGNESVPYVVNNVRIDRTPPVIFAQHTDPFVLSNVGPNPYVTTLRYRLSESDDIADNRQSAAENINVRIKLYNENTGENLWAQNGPGSLTAENTFTWEANSSFGKGVYKFQIVAYDAVGNFSTAYASCVKDGIAPVISYPSGGSEISGTVTIRGTAMDPDWTNDRPFKQYSIYYKRGSAEATINPDASWKTDLIEVPEIYRTPGSTVRNISVRPVQNDATLAYFHTGSLTNDVYTILVIAEEEGGTKYASARTITVRNDIASATGANPTINLGDIPSEVTFNGNNSLPISFTYGGKDINAYVEILKDSGGTREAVFYRYFPKLTANFYSGQPSYEVGNELGYFVWQDEAGWHIRWNGESSREHRFSGSIIATGTITDFNKVGDGITQNSSIISWDRNMTGGQGGVDFKTDSTQLIITSSIDNDPSTYEDDYSSLVTPYFGMSKYQPASVPVIITGISNQAGSTGQTVIWDGRIDTGAFVDNGNYIVRVRAEGADGSGLTVVEKPIRVMTPFELTNVRVSSNTFNPIGLPDRVTVSYNVSKDARIMLKVFRSGASDPLAIIDDGVQLGKTNPDFPHTISWRGNYPDKDGILVVTDGTYTLKLVALAVDGSAQVEQTITPSVRVESIGFSSGVQLDQIGNEVRYNGGIVRAAQGSSDYYWEARGSGRYYPPITYSYTLGVQGQQKASVYPYVPFAGILHRGFNQVHGKAKVRFKLHMFRNSVNIIGQVVGVAYTDVDYEPEPVDFTISKTNPEAAITFPLNASTWGWYGFSGIDVSVEVLSDDGFSLDKMYECKPAYEILYDNLAIYPTMKGIFNVKAKRGKIDTGNIDDLYHNAPTTIYISLASSFEYSRLTNRFVPWYGFINAKHSSYESFSYMNQYLQKLGFPGKDYFTDKTKKIEDYRKEIAGRYDADIYNPAAYKNEGKLVRETLLSKTAARTIGDTTVGAQDTYLSDEYIEFIPITEPDHGSFNYLGGIVEREETINGIKRIRLKNRLPAYPIEATTNYRIPYDSGNPRVETVKWPNDLAEINSKNAQLLSRLRPLILDPQSYSIDNTAVEIDKDELMERQAAYLNAHPELVLEGGWFKRKNISGVLRYNKSDGNYLSSTKTSLVNLIDPPTGYVTSYAYADFDKSIPDLNLNYDKENNKNSVITISAPASRFGQTWSTSDDPVLRNYSGGVIRGGPETFNADGFSPDGKSKRHFFWETYRNNYLRYQSYSPTESSYKYAFLAENNNPGTGKVVDNPDLVIKDWQITLKDEAGQVNQDLEVKPADVRKEDLDTTQHYFRTKLKYQARERRLVKLTGRADSDYELMYFDGQKWVTIARGPRTEGTLAFWDVGRLCGKYTVLLKTASAISARDVYIGDIVYHGLRDEKGENLKVSSVYKRAEVFFEPTSFSSDEFVSVTPVQKDEIYIRNKPIGITYLGPVVELKPSPYKFKTPADGEEGRPHLRFHYTTDDLNEGYNIVVTPSDIDNNTWQSKTSQLWIHQVTANGDLQPIQDSKRNLLKAKDINGDEIAYFDFEATLDHFSTYALLPGKFSLSAPMVFADRYITNKNTVTIYGTAEPGSVVSVYVREENAPPEVEKGEPYAGRMTAEEKTGNFRFENVPLTREGENYIFVTSHQKDNKDVRTWSDVTIIKDTVPPSVEATQNLYAFSPNGDGKYDSVDYLLKSNENGKIYFQLTANGSPLLNQEISAEAEKEVKLTWTKESFDLYRRDNTTGDWRLVTRDSLNERLTDGTYNVTVYAIDEAGNISNNLISQTILDTTPPTILELTANPNPFTPNDDGIKDTTKFWYKFSEPAYVSQYIYRDDGKLFRTHEGPTENFTYPTIVSSFVPRPSSIGSWEWDGRGSRNELLGGTYSWEVVAEDWVGNVVTSEVKQIVVDREPTLIPYAYAEPDPFAPVNPNNSFTEIKYYLSRDNLNVSVAVVGEGGKPIKTLVNNEVQGRGEHVVRWYGDYDEGYQGPTAAKNKYRIFDGSYEFQVRAVDPDSKNPAVVTNTVLVDNVAPAITTKPVKVDYAAKKATLAYTIPENVTLEVGVYSTEDQLLATLITSEAKSAGSYDLIYDFGHSTSDVGRRYFKLVAKDRALNETEVTTEAFAVVPNLFQITNHQAIPATFTPNGDGHTDLTRIVYNISGGVEPYTVSVSILNPAGATVKRLVDNENQSSGTYSFYWDGAADGGQLTADGYYEYQIIAEDRLGSRVEGRGSILLVSTRPTVDISTNLPIFSPNGDGSKDTVTFNYSINYPTFYITGEALVKIEVLNASGEAVWSKTFNHTAGNYSYTWDGSIPLPLGEGGVSDAGRVRAGNYYVRASAEDPLGTTAVPKTVNLAVDYTKPVVAIAEVSPNPFSPDPNGIRDETAISYTVSKPANVTIQIKNSSGEVVRELLSSERISSSGIKALAIPTVIWDGRGSDGRIVPDANYTIFISAIDDAGNTGEAAAEVTVDNNTGYTASLPPIRNIDVKPSYAKEGSRVTIDFSVPEELLTNPIVYVGSNLATLEGSEKLSDTRYDYHYSHVIGDDLEGRTRVYIQTTDLAGNISSAESFIIVDKTSPEVGNLNISPNPASIPSVSGPVSIKFNVSEALKEAPRVYVTQSGAPSQLLISNQKPETSNQYEAKYDVVPGYDGPALITIEATDLAGNISVYSFSDSLIVDTTRPVFSNIRSEIGSNPEFTKFAKEGSEVAIQFNVSESLKFNPDVRVNGNPATFLTLDPWPLPLYQYKYTVTSSDTNGNATISISGLDFALNEGTAETSSSKESFVIDLVTPEVLVGKRQEDPTVDLIADPQVFATNADPNDQDIHSSTTLHYRLVEDSNVTVSIHDMTGINPPYKKEQFNESNVVKSFDFGWQTKGQHNFIWEGKKADGTFAKPGKYAFIVKAQDYAGNVTMIKYGGTFWIQDNVLRLRPPEQLEFQADGISVEANPDPLFISPFGNSTQPRQKRARLYFRIDLGITPGTLAPSEWIVAKGIEDNIDWDKYKDVMKKVGTYQVKVYKQIKLLGSRLNILVWTSPVKDAYAGKIEWVDWGGTNEAGQKVADGKYKMVVEVKDFRGQPVYENTLGEKWVTVDNTPPTVSNLSVSNYYFCAGKTSNTDPARQTTTISYEVRDNEAKVYTTIDILRGGVHKIILQNSTSQDANAVYSKLWSGEGYDIDGTYTYRITTADLAGNTASAEGQAVMDKTAPTGTILINGNATYTISPSVTLNLTYSDTTSGMDKMSFSNDNSNWSAWENPSSSKSWTLPGADGTKYVYVRYSDKAGNFTTNINDSIILDTVNPNFNWVNVTETPTNSWSTHNSPSISFSVSDATSKVNRIEKYIDGVHLPGEDVDGAFQGTVSSNWHPTLSDGTHTVKLRVYDNAGRWTDSSTYTFLIDTTPPNAPSLTIDPAHTPADKWSNHNSPYLTWSDPGDGNGSGVRYYQGFIDGTYQGTVSSGWHPTLGEGTHTVYIRAVDGVGLQSANSNSFTFKIDTQPPSISQFGSPTFNPYVDGSVRVDFTASDPSPSSGFSASNISAKIKYGTNTVKTLSVVNNGGSNWYVTWDGTNGNNDYENEGDYILEISAADAAGNSATTMTSTIYLRDDVRITNNSANSNSPYLIWGQGSNLYLWWIEGWSDESKSVTAHAHAEAFPGMSHGGADETFNINFDQTARVTTWANDFINSQHWVFDRSGQKYYSNSRGKDETVSLLAGNCKASAYAERAGLTGGDSETTVYYKYRWYNQYTRTSSDLGKNWGDVTGPEKVDSYSTGPAWVWSKNYGHNVYSEGNNGNLYYRRFNSSQQLIGTVKITNSNAVRGTPSLTVDSNDNCYVAWVDNRDGNNEIYFQKIPVNFAPVRGTAQGAAIKVETQPITTTQSPTLELPTLLAPKGGNPVETRRPTFEWKAPKGAYERYLPVWARDKNDLSNPAIRGEGRAMREAIDGVTKKEDPSYVYFGYTVPYTAPALEANVRYYWTVIASSGETTVSPEAETFQCEPEFEISGVTNWPNPFNPNREETKIRYKLSKDADEVKIRIYDITGSLVVELDGDREGEGTSMITKYHDVKWNGRNGRNDVVVNGIYPFEVVARSGDKTVSGRGKIAVLK